MHRLQYRRKKAENLKSNPYLLLLHTQSGRIAGSEEKPPDGESWWHIHTPGG